MNEKFLSRGKREDTGKWVEGYYVELPEDQHGKQLHIIIDLDGQYNRIIPETAGRCVGLTDKNGKLMFEGDIVKAYLHNETKFTEKIEFRNGCFWFGNWNFIEFLDKFRNYEIIGNIHDNPNMLSRADMPVANDVFQPVLQPATPENFEIMNA